MSDWLALAEVGIQDAPGATNDRPVAWRGGTLARRGDFLRRVTAWQAAFEAAAGSRFALYFDDAYEFSAALYGAWHAGKEVYLPGDAQAATLERLLPMVDGTAGELPGAIEPAQDADLAPARRPLDLRATRLVVYTSGSGGEPVAMPKQLRQLDAEMHALQAAFGASLEQPHDGAGLARPDAGQEPLAVFSTVSHQHIYGLLFCIFWPLAAGRPLVAQRLVYPEEMAARLGSRRGILVSSPAHLKRLPATLDWHAARRNLVAVFSSGGPLPAEASQAAHALMGQSPAEVFGSSETGGIAWRQRAAHGERWNLLPGVAWRIEDGLLSVRSQHLPGDEWWLTSDIAEALPAGGFLLRGRADRIVKIEEKRVSLTAIEAALAASGLVGDCRAFMLAQPGGQRLAVVAVPTPRGWDELRRMGKRAFSDMLRERLLAAVERVALPRRLRFVRALPLNSQGKSTEALLSALFRPRMPEARWLSQEPLKAHALLDVVPELAVFDGHFDEMPVLAGVAQLDWAIAFGRASFAMAPRFLRAEALKFHSPVIPPARLELALQWLPEKGELHFVYSSPKGLHASGRAVFGSDS